MNVSKGISMGRKSLAVRLGRIIQKLPLRFLQFLEWPFLYLTSAKQREPKLLIILALPRSGSTVTYQTFVHGIKLQYLSNFSNLLYQLPLIGGSLARLLNRGHYSDFVSHHGFVAGLSGPAEGLAYWQWWLDSGLTDGTSHNLSPFVLQRRVCYLRRTLSWLTSRSEPFVTAYLGHALVPDRVAEAFPAAVFIRLRRDPLDNALSLLKCMRDDAVKWFSVLPDECMDWNEASEHERVAAQVYWLNRRLDDALTAHQYLEIDYEALCHNPAVEIEKVRHHFSRRGIDIALKFPLPDRFSVQRADQGGNVDAQMVRKALDHLEDKYGKLRCTL